MSDGDFTRFWGLDPTVDFLNHGSFGACPLPVLEAQERLRRRMEAGPVLFLHRQLEELADEARAELGAFLGADPEGLAFLPNATAGVNTVLRSFPFEPGDELLVCDHEYNASRNALEFAAEQAGARVVTVTVPFPLEDPGQVTEAFLAAVTPRTALALVDHVTSASGLVFPLAEIIARLGERGVEVLVDGAHAPGMLPLNLEELGAAYYTGNCHKWLCAPKGVAFLWVRADRREGVRPLAISHGMNSPRTDRSLFRLEFDWTGTHDPTPYLCLPEAIRFLGSLLPGGWPELMERNRALALRARRVLCAALGVEPPAPDSMIGTLAAVPLPDRAGPLLPPRSADPLQAELFDRHRIEAVVLYWPAPPQRWLRVSAQLYNRIEQYERLATLL